jgi:uncharacterized protein YPO0396
MSQNEYALLNEQINGLTKLVNARFENIDEKLEQIHTEAKRTNGRVTKTEEQIQSALVEREGNREHQKQIAKLVTDNCSEITQIKNSLQEYGMFMKYPKLFVAGLVVVVILTLAVFMESNPLKVFAPEKPQTEIPKE